MIRAALEVILSHWRRHPLQLATLVVGLALATCLWSAVQAINGEARASYSRAAELLGTARAGRLTVPNGNLKLATYVALRRAGWKVSPVLAGSVRFERQSFDIRGIDLLSHPLGAGLQSATEQLGEVSLDALQAPGLLFAHPETAALASDAQTAVPVIAAEGVPAGLIIADISLVSRLLEQPDTLSYLLVLPDQLPNLVPWKELAPELALIEANASETDTSRLTDSFHLNLTAFGLLSFAVGLFIVQGTISLSLEQRRGLIRTLRGLGVPMHMTVVLFAVELAAVALIAGAAGLAGGYFIAGALLPDVKATLSGLYGAHVEGSLSLRPGWIASGLAMAFAGTFAAGARGLYGLWRLPLLSAPGSRLRISQAGRTYLLSAGSGIFILSAGIIVLTQADGLLAGFAFLGGLMLGTALLLPLFAASCLSLASKMAKGPFAGWLLADTRAQLPGMSLALMALLLALATNIGVSTMVSSFRLTFQGWLDQRLSSEIYVTAVSDLQGRELSEWAGSQGITALPIRREDFQYQGAPLRVYGIVDDRTYQDNWPMLESLPDVWNLVADGKGLLINEQMSRRHGLTPGSMLEVAPGWILIVAGVFSDYGNPNVQAMVSLRELLIRAPDIPNRQFGLRVPWDQAQDTIRKVKEQFEIPTENIVDQNRIKERSLATFDRTFVITSALNALTLGVAAFAILTSLLTLWNQRLPNLAPVWAMGLTRRELAAAELFRSLVLAAITAILALPLGLVLAWALLSVINVEAFGWKLPMYLFPWDWVRLFLLALLAAAAAVAWPAIRLSKLAPASLLKVFANEH